MINFVLQAVAFSVILAAGLYMILNLAYLFGKNTFKFVDMYKAKRRFDKPPIAKCYCEDMFEKMRTVVCERRIKMESKLNYIIIRVRQFADERNLIWKVDDSCVEYMGVDVIFTSKDYGSRSRYTLQYEDLAGRDWRMSIDARLNCIFALVIKAFGLDSEPTRVHAVNYVDCSGIVNRYRIPSIKNVIFNDPATIVFWNDGTKTIVKAQDGDIFDPEKGLAMAISKKALGNKGNYCETFKKWLPEEEDKKEYEPNSVSIPIKSRANIIIDAMKAAKDLSEIINGCNNENRE